MALAYKMLRFVRLPICDGMVPSKLFPFNRKSFKSVSWPMVVVSVLVKLFLLRSLEKNRQGRRRLVAGVAHRVVKPVRSPMSLGNEPMSPAPEKFLS